METKKKTSKLKAIIILALVLIALSTGAVSALVHSYPMDDHHDGVIVWGPTKGEIFKQFWDDPNNYNWDNLPTWLFAEYNISLWCAQKGGWIGSNLVTEEHYWAWKDETETATVPYDEYNPFKWYRRSETMGLIKRHTDKYNQFIQQLKGMSPYGITGNITPYEGDDQAIIDSLDYGAPGLAGDPKPSIEWYFDHYLDLKDYQNIRYILTARKIYPIADEVPREAEAVNKEDGEFDVAEKQNAIWQIPEFNQKGIQVGDDRNLGYIAKKYQEFYDKIHNDAGEDKYEDIIEPHNAWKDKDEMKETADDIEEDTIELGGEELKDYKYKDTGIEVDAVTGAYLLGPYCIDYSVDDENKDRYGAPTLDFCEVKFNAIQDITVYNQDGKDIVKDFGGEFRIVYPSEGAPTSKEEAKLIRINDKPYEVEGVKLDGEEIYAPESRRPFYIVVLKGDMKAEDFQGIHAKIDFQYLEHTEATVAEYKTRVYEHYYTKTQGEKYQYYYSGQYLAGYTPWGAPIWGGWSKSEKNVDTYIYELHREESSQEAQIMAAYSHDGWRFYKKHSIVISSDWKTVEPIDIEALKQCSQCGALYGAEFEIELQFEGKDGQNETEVNKTLFFTRITDTKGLIRLSAEEIEAQGVYLNTYSGYITAIFREIAPPAGHKLNSAETTMVIRLEKGELQTVGGGTSSSEDNKAVAKIVIDNEDGGTPVIQLAKVDSNAGLVKEAFFEVHVSFTDPAGVVYDNGKVASYGEVIDKQYNVIRGKTKDGILNLTAEDFANMKYPLNITGYTGKITLDVVEVRVDGGGYSISPSSKDITLTYHAGELVDYTEYTDAPVITHYVYDNQLAKVYDWLKGTGSFTDMNNQTQDYVTKWISTQLNKHSKDGMKYEDVLGWLVEYIESGVKEGTLNINTDLEEWKNSTLTTEATEGASGPIAQITIENFPGSDIDFPDIPEKPEPNPLLMKLAGTVFLDQTTTKGQVDESNGKLDKGETLLMGIEVTLYEEDGTKAELAQEEGEIRTNPTMTNFNGYYEFRGLDPTKKYYVEFKYNGMAYKTTNSSSAEYNSEEWAVTSKGSDLSSSRAGVTDKYKQITYDTKVYDYYEIEGLYIEMAKQTLQYIQDNEEYPSDPYSLIGAHPEDKELADKIEFMKACEVKAYAGYNSIQSGIGSESGNGTYAHSSLGDRFVLDGPTINNPDNEVSFAGDKVKKLYPGQLQVHLGLIERDKTDLSLLTDIVETVVEENGYETKYNYHQGLSSYHQYIFAEDYNYSKTPNTEGIAYYTEDNIDLYLTYEITVRNDTSIPTTPLEIVDYYNKRFTYSDSYTTSKGNTIAGLMINGSPASGVSSSGFNNAGLGSMPSDYSALFIKTGQTLSGPGDELKIQITLKLTEPGGHATEALKEMLEQPDDGSEVSRAWDINNYAEINGYQTDEGYVDRDSRPGNFEISEFEKLLDEYQKAYAKYVFSQSEDDKRAVKLALGRMTDLREDDAWKETLILSNNGYVRELSGNVWEAISDEVKSSLDLQSGFGDRILTKSDASELNLEGIKVELVELLKDNDPEAAKGANQLVRGQTYTDAEGNYKFRAYIAGDYAVRFVYGEYDDPSKTVYSKVSVHKYDEEKEGRDTPDKLPINGQYYQSTKANPNTDSEQYWYKQRVYNETTKLPDEITGIPRYSDAYDDAYSRMTQMKSKIENVEEWSTSSEYNYDGVLEVETTRHTDPIYAYTSTMELEIEYTRPETSGNATNLFYGYAISDVDFGITPRAYNDVNIDKYVANIKLYTGDGNLLVDANFDENGNQTGSNIVSNELKWQGYVLDPYKDNLIDIYYNTELLQGTLLEVTYKVTVSNDSERYDDKGIYDTIKYISKDGKVVAVAYYNEAAAALTSYEGNGRGNGTLVYHNTLGNTDYSETALNNERDARASNMSDRLRRYSLITGYQEGSAEIITSKATNIVDYINPPFGISYQITHGGETKQVNQDWVLENITENDFVSSREKYQTAEGIPILKTLDRIIMAKDSSDLCKDLKPGEKGETTIVLSSTQGNSASGSSDFEFSNFIEITRLGNSAGKIVDMEGYDLKSEIEPETSKVRHVTDVDGDNPKYVPTISTSKSATIKIRTADGLNLVQNVVGSNALIVVVALVILASGIVLIKKFVIPSNK